MTEEQELAHEMLEMWIKQYKEFYQKQPSDRAIYMQFEFIMDWCRKYYVDRELAQLG